MSISSRSYSNDVIKYGDVEKEKEIEKRLKELGLWENKVHQEREVERMLDDRIEKSDKLSQVIRRARRRRERSVREDIEQIDGEPDGSEKWKENGEPFHNDREKEDKRAEGIKTMDEIRNIVKPSIIRDKKGAPLAYHIDVMMGCFNYDVTHHMTNDGYQVVLFGATSPSNPLTGMSFLSSKSLPSLFSPTLSPRSISPQRNEIQNVHPESTVHSRDLVSTLRYRRDRDGQNDNNLYERKTEKIVTDVRRLTKEISVELPRSVDVSQLIVDYRRGVFKIRVPFFIQSQENRLNPSHQPPKSIVKPSTSSIDHHSNHPSLIFPQKDLHLSRLKPIKCQTSNLPSSLSSSSPSSLSPQTIPTSRTERTPSSPLSPNNRAFHSSSSVPCTKTNASESSKENSTNKIAQESEINQPLDGQSKRLENLSIATNNQYSFFPSSEKKYLNKGLLTVLPKDNESNTHNLSLESTAKETEAMLITNGLENKTKTDSKTSRPNFSNSMGSRKCLELKNFFEKKSSDVSVSAVDQARYNGGSTPNHVKDVIRKKKDAFVNTIPCVDHSIQPKPIESKRSLKIEHDYKIPKEIKVKDNAKLDLKTIPDQETTHRSDIISDDQINISSLDDLVSVNSAWSDDDDLETLLQQCVHSTKRIKRSLTEVIQNVIQNAKKNSKARIKKKIRSKSFPGFVKSPGNLKISEDEVLYDEQNSSLVESSFKNSREVNLQISADNLGVCLNDFHTIGNIDLLEESNI